MLRRKFYYSAFLLWSLIYIIGTIIAPLAPSRFNLSTTKTHLIQITFVIPIVLIWALAFYGAEKFKNYALSIRKHPDGKALNQIANGLIILTAAVMSGGLSGIFRPWAVEDHWLKSFTIIFNYIEAFLPLVAFYCMYRGSVDLRRLAAKKRGGFREWVGVIIVMIVIAVTYTAVLLHYPYRDQTPDPNQYSSFYLPTPLILLTLALPYVIGWGLGIKAALNIVYSQRIIKGSIYRSAMFRFAMGIIFVVGFAILVQILSAFSTYFAHIGIAAILIIIYLAIIIYSIGFLLIAMGSKKLAAIEKAV
jgi:hypothetical protein